MYQKQFQASQPYQKSFQTGKPELFQTGKQDAFQTEKQRTYQTSAINNNFTFSNTNPNAFQQRKINSYQESANGHNFGNLAKDKNYSKANRYHLSGNKKQIIPQTNNLNSYNEPTYGQQNSYPKVEEQQLNNQFQPGLTNQKPLSTGNNKELGLNNQFTSPPARSNTFNGTSNQNNVLGNQNNVLSNQDNVPNNLNDVQINNLFGDFVASRSDYPSYQINLSKMDGLFAECFKSLKWEHIFHTLIVLALLAGAIALQAAKYSKPMTSYSTQFMKRNIIPFVIAFQSIILIARLFIFCSGYNSLSFALRAAGRCSSNVQGQNAQLDGSFEANTSKRVYIAEESILYNRQLSDAEKNIYVQRSANKIRAQVRGHSCCSFMLISLSEIAMFGISIYLIVMLAQNQTDAFQKVVFISTIVYYFILCYKFIACVILVALIPLIIIVVIIFFCIKQTRKRSIQLPAAFNPTQQQITNGGGSCTICMMDFMTVNSVIALPCSDKHMFHQICINGWFQVKTTCPICRYDLLEHS